MTKDIFEKDYDAIDAQLINFLHDGFPICRAPYQQVATQLGLSEKVVLTRLQRLLDAGIISRFGPLYHAERIGGALTLVALKVPPAQFEQIAAQVNAFPQVAHNYARDHELNMWFVLATETPQELAQTLVEIATQTGLHVYNMPKLNEYFVGLKLEA